MRSSDKRDSPHSPTPPAPRPITIPSHWRTFPHPHHLHLNTAASIAPPRQDEEEYKSADEQAPPQDAVPQEPEGEGEGEAEEEAEAAGNRSLRSSPRRPQDLPRLPSLTTWT